MGIGHRGAVPPEGGDPPQQFSILVISYLIVWILFKDRLKAEGPISKM